MTNILSIANMIDNQITIQKEKQRLLDFSDLKWNKKYLLQTATEERDWVHWSPPKGHEPAENATLTLSR